MRMSDKNNKPDYRFETSDSFEGTSETSDSRKSVEYSEHLTNSFLVFGYEKKPSVINLGRLVSCCFKKQYWN